MEFFILERTGIHIVLTIKRKRRHDVVETSFETILDFRKIFTALFNELALMQLKINVTFTPTFTLILNLRNLNTTCILHEIVSKVKFTCFRFENRIHNSIS